MTWVNGRLTRGRLDGYDKVFWRDMPVGALGTELGVLMASGRCVSISGPRAGGPLGDRLNGAIASVPRTQLMTKIEPGQTRIGWIGTGVMGRSMCGHLIDARATPRTIFNRSPEKTVGPRRQRCRTLSGSPKEVAENSDVVFTIVGFPTRRTRSHSRSTSGVLGRGAARHDRSWT